MKKRRIIAITLSIVFIIASVFFFVIENTHRMLSFVPKDNVSVNGNNYYHYYSYYYNYNVFDYHDGRFAYLDDRFLKKELIIVDSYGNHKYVKGIDPGFAVVEDNVIFIKSPSFGNNHKLMSKNIDKGKTDLLSDRVLSFAIYKDYIIYETSDESLNNYLNICDLDGEDHKILCKNISKYCINNDILYVTTDDVCQQLISISLKDFFYKDVMSLGNFGVNSMMSCDDKLLFYVDNGFELLNLQTKEFKNLGLDFTAKKIDFICDENSIYLTLQNVKYNGSLVSDVESEDNGLWKINLETFEKEKILSDVFWDLYLAGNGQLFGTLDGVPYLIDTETRQIQKIID